MCNMKCIPEKRNNLDHKFSVAIFFVARSKHLRFTKIIDDAL